MESKAKARSPRSRRYLSHIKSRVTLKFKKAHGTLWVEAAFAWRDRPPDIFESTNKLCGTDQVTDWILLD